MAHYYSKTIEIILKLKGVTVHPDPPTNDTPDCVL